MIHHADEMTDESRRRQVEWSGASLPLANTVPPPANIVHSNACGSIKTSEKPFDFMPNQTDDTTKTAESFRWVDFENLNEDTMSLPIDKVAIQILKQSF
jgi:hypothetical protein